VSALADGIRLIVGAAQPIQVSHRLSYCHIGTVQEGSVLVNFDQILIHNTYCLVPAPGQIHRKALALMARAIHRELAQLGQDRAAREKLWIGALA